MLNIFFSGNESAEMSMGNLPDLTQTGLVEKNTKISYYQKNQIILKQYARRHFSFKYGTDCCEK